MTETDRIGLLEKQIEGLAMAINKIQSRIGFLEKLTEKQASIETLSVGTAQIESSMPEKHITDEDRIPASMKRTLRAVSKGPTRGVTSGEAARITGRSQNLESSYLHRLFETHRLTRNRVGRNVYYSACCLRRLRSGE